MSADLLPRIRAARRMAWSADRAESLVSLMAEAIRWHGASRDDGGRVSIPRLQDLGFSASEIVTFWRLALSRSMRLPPARPGEPRTADMAAIVEAIRSAEPVLRAVTGAIAVFIAIPLAMLIIFP